MMGSTTSFKPDEARFKLLKEFQESAPPELPAQDGRSFTVSVMNLKNILCEINSDGSNLHLGGSFQVDQIIDDHFGTSMPNQGPSIPSGHVEY